MLIPFQTSGTRPPFFMLHGLFGLYTADPGLCRTLGPDRPVYGLTAPGYAREAPPHRSVPPMAADHARAIVAAWPRGPYYLGAYCEGGRVVVEVARLLIAEGRRVAKVILVDPGAVPYKNARALALYESAAASPEALAHFNDIARQAVVNLGAEMRTQLFDRGNREDVERATEVAMATNMAIHRFAPEPFDGASVLILSSDRAPNFFDRTHAWQHYLRGPRVLHVLEGGHGELLAAHGRRFRRLMRAHVDADLPAPPHQLQAAAS